MSPFPFVVVDRIERSKIYRKYRAICLLMLNLLLLLLLPCTMTLINLTDNDTTRHTHTIIEMTVCHLEHTHVYIETDKMKSLVHWQTIRKSRSDERVRKLFYS